MWASESATNSEVNKQPLLFFKAYHLQTFTTGWRIIGSDTVLQWLASAGTPHSNRVGLQARGLFDVLFTSSPEVWVRVWTAVCLLCDPSTHRRPVQGVALTAGALDISNSANLNAAEAVLPNGRTELRITLQRKGTKLGSMLASWWMEITAAVERFQENIQLCDQLESRISRMALVRV